MTSSATTRNRLEKIGPGEQLNSWGGPNGLNRVIDLIDALADGWVTISAAGATTLSSNNYTADQSRMRCIKYTGSSTGTLTVPSVEKWYWVWAVTSDAIVTTGGGATATVKAGSIASVHCDGADCRKGQDNDFGGSEITNIGTPTANTSAVTKAYADGLAFASTNLPGITASTNGQAVKSDGSTAAWGYTGFQGFLTKTSGYTIALTDRAKIVLCNGTFTLAASSVSTLGAQYYARIINIGTGLVTFDPNSAETITFPGQSAKASCVLLPGEGIDIFSDGSSGFYATLCVKPNICLYAYETTPPSYTAATWTARVISTLSVNTIGASYSSGEIQGVPAGVYQAEFSANGAKSNSFSARLYNNTTAAVLGYSDTAQPVNAEDTSVTATGVLDINLSATTSLTLATYGSAVGGAWSVTAAGGGAPAVAAQLRLFRVSP